MWADLQGTICSISVNNLQFATKNRKIISCWVLSQHMCQRSLLINIYKLLTSKLYSNLHPFNNWPNTIKTIPLSHRFPMLFDSYSYFLSVIPNFPFKPVSLFLSAHYIYSFIHLFTHLLGFVIFFLKVGSKHNMNEVILQYKPSKNIPSRQFYQQLNEEPLQRFSLRAV